MENSTERKEYWAVVLGLKPQRDGNEWFVLCGDNIQVGVVGFGSTPEEAIHAFESAMCQRGGSARAFS